MNRKKNPRELSPERAQEYQRAREVLLKHWSRLKRRQGVHGVEVGLRERNNEVVDEVVLKVLVDEKLADEQLHPSRRIGPEIDGVPVDIVAQKRYQPSTNANGAGYDTLQGGVAISPASLMSKFGTLGITVFRPDGSGNRVPWFLTNAHVVLGRFAKPCDLPPNQQILQRSRNGSKTRVIGTILKNKTVLNSLVDCALIAPDPSLVLGVDFQPRMRGIAVPQFRIGSLTDADVNNKVTVVKVGAATNQTKGIVQSITRTFNAPGTPERPGMTFFLQIAIRPSDGGQPFSGPGDSGSVVIRGDEIVGLLHGLTDDGIAIASPMTEVKAKLIFEV